MTFKKIFQNIVLCQNTGKQKELKYLAVYVLGKSWFEEFHKIHAKETLVESFLVKWQPATLLIKDSLQIFSYVTEAIRVCLKYILKMFKILIN